MRSYYLLPALTILLLAGCDSLTEADGLTGADLQSASTVPDISGAWDYSSVNFIHLDEFSAEVIFGFEPEGTRTTLRCAAEGSMTIAQTGSTFTGSIASVATCVTTGGQVAVFADDGPIVNGAIQGRSVHFDLLGDPGAVECPARGVVKLQAGLAVSLQGTFGCIEPGHPQSTWEAPPPRFGPNRTQWEAQRPS